jgi:hypothetical protein
MLRTYNLFLTSSLKSYTANSRTHSDDQIAQVVASIKEFGFTNPILIDGENGVIAGHCRVEAAKQLGLDEVPCIVLDNLSEAQKRAYVIADNKLALNAGWDIGILQAEFEALKEVDFNLELTGFSLDELSEIMLFEDDDLSPGEGDEKGSLCEQFLVPPFTVLDARQGYWQDRKRMWHGIGIKSEEGRDAECLQNNMTDEYGRKPASGTSIFDPVLCELVYRWFSHEDGLVLDPFAGGSVRGVVAARCKRQYVGVDLRQEQIDQNLKQLQSIDMDDYQAPAWVVGDSRNIQKLAAGSEADLVFSCPPYADLEVYSDDPNDLSTLSYCDFITAYREIISNACAMLKDNRFACFVVGDIRDKKGNYQNFVSHTIQAFLDAGLKLYNEAILITPNGTLSLRAGKQFKSGRKLGKGHQNVLVFLKGDAKKATAYCGQIEIIDMEVNDEPTK